MRVIRKLALWGAVIAAMAVPIFAAASSPLLAWRDVVYIIAGFAGVTSLALLLLQPLLAAGHLPGLTGMLGRRVHRRIGGVLLVFVVIHIGGLWITSPPDVIDALLFVSPTPFSAWGVIAMWAIFAAAGLAVFRRRLKLAPRKWRRIHTGLAVVVVGGSIVHALLIEGTMETLSKTALCILVAGATLKALVDLKIWSRNGKPRAD